LKGWLRILVILLVALLAWRSLQAPHESGADSSSRVSPGGDAGRSSQVQPESHVGQYPGFLPSEAIKTLDDIKHGGPYPYDRDGTVFLNREHRLPDAPDDYYREYTVRTPGSSDRGARRIVTGGDPPVIYYYTDDHYRTFRMFEVPR
jgi:guanyl-specific ribonuclease Sa